MSNYYDELGINRHATGKEIKIAYRALGKKYHPDVHAGDKKFAEHKMKIINIAYEVLSNSEKKKKYDLGFSLRSKKSSNTNTEPSAKPANDFKKNSAKKFVKISVEMKEEIYNKALNMKNTAQTQEAFLNAAELFKKIVGYKNAYFTGVECERIAARIKNENEVEEHNEEIYLMAFKMMAASNSAYDFLKTSGAFAEIRGYKNSDRLAVDCKKKALKLSQTCL